MSCQTCSKLSRYKKKKKRQISISNEPKRTVGLLVSSIDFSVTVLPWGKVTFAVTGHMLRGSQEELWHLWCLHNGNTSPGSGLPASRDGFASTLTRWQSHLRSFNIAIVRTPDLSPSLLRQFLSPEGAVVIFSKPQVLEIMALMLFWGTQWREKHYLL